MYIYILVLHRAEAKVEKESGVAPYPHAHRSAVHLWTQHWITGGAAHCAASPRPAPPPWRSGPRCAA